MSSVFEFLPSIISYGSGDTWVGGSSCKTGSQTAILRHWDGVRLTDFLIPGLPDAQVTALAGSGATDIWAFGNLLNVDGSGSAYKAMLCAHWNGVEWTKVPIPEFGTLATWINSALAVSPSELWVVGNTANAGDRDRSCFAARCYNGKWSVPPLPNLPSSAKSPTLRSAAMDAATIWAAGTYSKPNGNPAPLVTCWDGSAWRLVDSPSGDQDAEIWGIQVWDRQVWIAGSGPGLDSYSGFWDGTQWTVLPSLKNIWMAALHADPANGLWVAGWDYAAQNYYVASWSGTSWTSVPVPKPLPGSYWTPFLSSISGRAADDVWFSGPSTSSASTGVILNWNGARWTVVLAPRKASVSVAIIRHNTAGIFEPTQQCLRLRPA
jgi:hypothetical protein